jgi:hypothetical protein
MLTIMSLGLDKRSINSRYPRAPNTLARAATSVFPHFVHLCLDLLILALFARHIPLLIDDLGVDVPLVLLPLMDVMSIYRTVASINLSPYSLSIYKNRDIGRLMFLFYSRTVERPRKRGNMGLLILSACPWHTVFCIDERLLCLIMKLMRLTVFLCVCVSFHLNLAAPHHPTKVSCRVYIYVGFSLDVLQEMV